MIKKLKEYGNSRALVIDKPIVDLLNISHETQLEISTPDGVTLVIRPVREQFKGSADAKHELVT
jgi:antitoxin component of MazEF toxin-antitoxin module